ncbi:MAG: MaoC family dehydratase [Actinomycetota bacterium]|nr:MaoC family dehydratase [Actinomycetota bacterium]MDQ6948120.1 MaoC family dehydratase [Actinomycetota bacterium]
MNEAGPLRVELDQLDAYVGKNVGRSAWYTITQEQVNRFADATHDHQWIHVDPARAEGGPFGQTIAHGYLTLSMAPVLLFEVLEVAGVGLVINYGANRVRFPAPVLVGSRLRASVDLLETTAVEGGVQATFRMTFEAEGTTKPVCVAEIVYRYFRADQGHDEKE